MATGSAQGLRRYVNTASTRRCCSSAAGRSSFMKIDEMCFSTAPSDTTRWPAIPAFDRPSAIRLSTSRSRGVRAANGSRRRDRWRSWAIDLGVEGSTTVCYPVDGGDELPDIGDAFFEEVPEADRRVGEQFGGVALLDVLRQHQHRRSGPHPAQFDRRPQPLIGVGRWHPYVDDDDVGIQFDDRLQQPCGVAESGDHLVAVLGEQPGDSLAQQHGVLGDHDAHGSSTDQQGRPVERDSPGGTGPRPRAHDHVSPASPPPGCDDRSPVAVVADFDDQPVAATADRHPRPGRPASVWPMLVNASTTTKYAAASIAGGGRWGRSTWRSTGIGDRAVTADNAASSPRSVSTCG